MNNIQSVPSSIEKKAAGDITRWEQQKSPFVRTYRQSIVKIEGATILYFENYK